VHLYIQQRYYPHYLSPVVSGHAFRLREGRKAKGETGQLLVNMVQATAAVCPQKPNYSLLRWISLRVSL